ncbi:MAG: ATP-binding protein [Deltaproteobacteria bacterium]|nr:ATP-binding protein [Deltaproteobacteria bacterium]
MDPTRNPFAPSAGAQPPELAGRESTLKDAQVELERAKLGRPARGQLLLGLRGVGKTVLLNRLALDAEQRGHHTILLEAPEDKRLGEMLVPALRKELYNLSTKAKLKTLAQSALSTLRAFASTFKLKVGEIHVDIVAQRGVADSGNLESDLPDLLLAVGQVAKE